MLNENPLDLIRSMNEQKKTEKEEEANIFKASISAINQENIDQEYVSLEKQKRVLVEDVEKLKQKMKEIKGTREEMILQYREVINEAKKNPETLKYVRENFSDIFKEGKEKWQEIRNELSLAKELGENKDEDIQNLNSQIEEIFSETTEGKLKIKRDKEKEENKERRRQWEIKDKEKTIKRLEENIENGKAQKEDYSNILDQEVEYTRENYLSGEAKIISDDATEFTKLWKEFPTHPFVISGNTADVMVKELKNKNYSDKDIERYKEKRNELEKIQKRIESDLQKNKARWSEIGYARSNNIKYPSFPFISVGHGNHFLDESLMGQRMTLGELLDKDIEIKTKELEEAKKELQEIVKETEKV